MSYSKDFENKVLDFISNMSDFVKEQKEFNQKIEKRLDVLELFHKDDFKMRNKK